MYATKANNNMLLLYIESNNLCTENALLLKEQVLIIWA